MKNLALTFAAVLVFTSSIFAGTDDNKTASHNISISINDLALIGIRGGNGSANINLSPDAPTIAGQALDFSKASDNSLWLNYSSIVSASNKSRSINAKIESDLPGGTSITVSPKSATNGRGKVGTAAESVILSKSDQKVVSGIGSCYTGTGTSKGVQLDYKLNMQDSDYGKLFNQEYSVTVTYTITDEN